MIKTLIILTATLFITLTAKGQNLFFIGEDSYPCTETFILQSNSGDEHNLTVLFAKDGTTGLFVVSAESYVGAMFYGKLIIYLDNGEVITFIDSEKSDRVDERAKAVYSLTNEDLNKMKKSNINTVRYTIRGGKMFYNGNWTALNKGTPTKTLITEFFMR